MSHFIKSLIAFSIIFLVGIFGLFVIHKYGGAGSSSASLVDYIKSIGGGK